MVNRYEQLVSEIPAGSFYASTGHVLPRRDDPYELLFETNAASTIFGVFDNTEFKGTITTDANGDAIVSLTLGPGRHDIRLENDDTGQQFFAYVSVRNWATWHAAYAQALEGTPNFFGIDPAIDSVSNATRLEDADSIHIEDSQGKLVAQPNDLGYINDTYRNVLQSLRQAYRIYAGKLAGIRQVVSAYTSVLPLVLDDRWRPKWILGSQLAPSPGMEEHATSTDTVLTNLNAESRVAVHAAFPSTSSPAPGPTTNPPTSQALTVTFDGAWDGGDVTVVGTAPGGGVISEVFTATPGSTVTGVEVFTTVGTISFTTGTLGTASVGLAESRFITIVEFEGDNVLTPTDLTYETVSGDDVLVWGGTITVSPFLPVEIPFDGRYTLHGPETAALTSGLVSGATAATAIFDFSDGGGNEEADRVWLNIADVGVISIPVSVTSLAAASVDDVVSDINTALTADPRYGSAAALALTGDSPLARAVVTLFSTNYGVGEDTEIQILPGCADAALQVFGLPRFRTDVASGPIAAFSTSLTYDNAATRLPDESSSDGTWDVRVGRMDIDSNPYATSANTGAIENSTTPGPFAEFVDTAVDALEHFDFVRAAFAANVASTTTSITNPPFAQTLCITFGATWTATGVISVSGTDADGNSISEFFTPVTSSTVFGSTEFATVTSIDHAGDGGAETADLGLALKRDLGGCVRIYGAGTAANDGLHTIVDAIGQNRWLIKHEDHGTGGAFTNEAAGTLDWQLWTPGEVVEVTANDTGTGTLTLASPGLLYAKATDDLIELAEEMPFVAKGDSERGTIVVDVDTDYLPTTGTPVTDSLTLDGSDVPDGWLVTNAAATRSFEALYEQQRLILTNDGVGETLFTADIARIVPTLRGFPVQIRFWVQQHNITGTQDFSIELDTGGGFSALTLDSGGTTLAVAGTVFESSTGDGSIDPSLVSATVSVPYNATQFTVRLRHASSTSGHQISIERAIVAYVHGTALSMGENTVLRGDHRDNFGEILYIWSPDELRPPLPTVTEIDVTDTFTYNDNAVGNDTITRTSGSFVTDGFQVGTQIVVSLTSQNNGVFNVEAVAALTLTLSATDELVSETALSRIQSARSALPEVGALGLPVPPASTPDTTDGQIDLSMNAHGLWERFDVSEYSSGDPVNISEGAQDETSWLASTLTNMIVVTSVPGRLSYVYPGAVVAGEFEPRLSRIEGEVLSPDSFGVAALSEDTTHEGSFPQDPNGSTQLYEDGVPVPDTGEAIISTDSFTYVDSNPDTITRGSGSFVTDGFQVGHTLGVAGTASNDATDYTIAGVAALTLTLVAADELTAEGPVTSTLRSTGAPPYVFTAADTLDIDAAEFDSNAVYTIDYDRVIRAETDVIDLGAAFADYLWLTDAVVYQRTNDIPTERTITVGVTFAADFSAALARPSDQVQNTSTLTRDDGVSATLVPQSAWRYTSPTSIEIDQQEFDSGSLYTLEYDGLSNDYVRVADFTIEGRSAATSGAVSGATYEELAIDQPINPANQFHQFRITITGVEDTRDIRVLSLGARGINLFGTPPNAPGIITP